MKVNAIQLDQNDNVVTCINKISQGETVIYQFQKKFFTVVANEEIPAWHKIAIQDISLGADVIKYGESIGIAQNNLLKGSWVYHLNVSSVPRSYEEELV